MTADLSPTFSFTIPSIHDDTELQARIYNPPYSVLAPDGDLSSWRARGAIIAHPYAPLGGCYDDPVVLCLVEEIVKLGFIVGTFNVRGAGGSKGRTSWTAKAEVQDYVSMIGLFTSYISIVHNDLVPESSLQSPTTSSARTSIDLILGGYSYGSLLASHLPSTADLLARFSAAPATTHSTAITEINLRARHLAQEVRHGIETHRLVRERQRQERHSNPQPSSPGMCMGGHESAASDKPRRSHEFSRQSIDVVVRRSMDRGRRKLGLKRPSSGSLDADDIDHTTLPASPTAVSSDHDLSSIDLKTSYLLVSPLLPPISSLATLFCTLPTTSSTEGTNNLAIYGDRDTFTSHRKLQRWASQRAHDQGSAFQYHEIESAGHFWREDGVEDQLRSKVRAWIKDVVLGT